MRYPAAVALSAGLLVAGLSGAADRVWATGSTVSHGLSTFGDLKYGAGFTHFDYVNPNAPKGGVMRLRGIGSYDSLNPFILKGVAPSSMLLRDGGGEMVYDTLMARADDEADAVYGLIAESVEMADDRTWVSFTIRPQARWSDGSPITADDVAFSYETLLSKGAPQFKVRYKDFESVTALTPKVVRFTFRAGAAVRDLPLFAAGMPILSKAYWSSRDFAKSTLEPPVNSGPYVITDVKPGRSVTFRRNPDYWGRDLPVNRGRWNFDAIRVDYYRDRGIAREAFFAGEYDFREEFTSKAWAIEYDPKPAVQKGWIQRRTLKDETPSGVQAFFLNNRRTKFADSRVREALGLAFDFEWTNKTLFHGLYERTTSMFENSELAAKGPPTPAELALLEPYRGQVPDGVFKSAFVPATTDGSGKIRENLRKATKLLKAAGWRIKDGSLRNAAGQEFTMEFLMYERSFERIIAPYVRNLKRLGINARMRIVDVANFENRMREFDFDVTTRRYIQPLTPGLEQQNYWGSDYAEQIGSANLAGIKSPVVDALVGMLVKAGNREELVTAARALDRVLMWNHYVVPHWFKGAHTIAFWDKFGWPDKKPNYDRGIFDTWWFDRDKDKSLQAARSADN